MRTSSVLATTALVAASVLGVAGSATAAEANAGITGVQPMANCIGYVADQGYGCFDADGDHFYVKDTLADGRGIQVRWETNYGRSGICRDYNGTSDGVQDCNENLAEGRGVRLWLELTNDGSIVDRWGPTGWITI